MGTRVGNITDKRSRGVFSYEGELWEDGRDRWMEMEGEWDTSDKRLLLLK